jgi:hypothetical protein
VTYTNPAKVTFNRRLSKDWHDLALYLDIPSNDVDTFRQGREAAEIWDWLAVRRRLHELPDALVFVQRDDLAELLRQNERADQGDNPNGSGWRRAALVASVVAVVAVAAFAIATRPWAEGIAWVSSGLTSRPPSPDGTGARVIEARIDGTMDVNSNRFVGLISYRDPTENGRGTDAGHYPEDGTVYVVCVKMDGREIRDEPWRDRPLSTRVWYRLSTTDPQWVPSMYVRLVPVAGQTPAVPLCGA